MERLYEESWALAHDAHGPLSPHIGGFVSSLIEQQYSAWFVRLRAHRAVDFDRWLAQRRVALDDVDDRHVARYHRDRSRGRYRPWHNELRALRELLEFLRARGAIARSSTGAEALPAGRLALRFEQYLRQERGLAAATITRYRAFAQQFLSERFGEADVALGELRAADVVEFVQRQATRRQPHALKQVVTALRSFLRYAQYLGEARGELVAAVPAVAAWATTPPIPRAISTEHVRRVLAHCDGYTATGRRDHAVLLLLARLGLRAGEIANLTLDDVDWEAGQLRVRGKAGRDGVLPLPADVGEAIVAYLHHGRPGGADRHLFLRARAPVRGFKAEAVGAIVRLALARAGIDAPRKGAHQFRHALAVRMLQRGASLAEIGEVLRHRSPEATAIYARIDLGALRALALPWPGRTA
jgi:site-specific recombinase XerD